MPIDLTDEQSDAVRVQGNAWVIACPGSGKTRVALAKTLREAALLAPNDQAVLVLSFSVSAKEEIERRIAAHAGPKVKKAIVVSTIHGFALSELVTPFGKYVAGRDLSLALDGGSAYSEALIAIQERFGVSSATLRKALQFRRRAPDGSTFSGSDISTPEEHELAVAFWDELLAQGYVDYPNSLYVALQIVRSHSWIREGLAAQFPSVIIDEYQDCTDIQVAIVEELTHGGSQIFLVGDLFQCVFGFAGANVDTLHAFADRIGAVRQPLRGTHRCPTPVIEVAERIFKRNIEAVGEARTRRSDVIFDHSTSAIPTIQKLVALCDQRGITRDDIAFVCTANFRIEQIISDLASVNIPAAFGRSRVREDDWYGQIIEAYLLADSPLAAHDIESLGQHVLSLMARFGKMRTVNRRVRERVVEAVAGTVLTADRLPDARVDAIAPIMHENIILALRRSGVVSRLDLVAIDAQLSEELREYSVQVVSRQTRSHVLDILRPQGKIRGYTYQGIKGLQFSGVAVVDVRKDRLPHSSMADLWDDARKLYVGLTRSMSILAVHAPEWREVRSMFYPLITGQSTAEDVIGSPLPESLETDE